MNTLSFSTGSIIRLEGIKHCDVALDAHRVIGLIASQDEPHNKKICKLFLADLRTMPLHPVTEKPASYTLVHEPVYPIDISQMKERLQRLKSKYEGTEYNIIQNNCQHFAWELITGERKSPDADKWKMLGPLSSAVGAIRDFGSTNSSESLVDINPFRENLALFLMTPS
jgi:hypothetical protein